MRVGIVILILALMATLLAGCSAGRSATSHKEVESGDSRFQIATTTYTVYEFANQVGKDNVHVFLLPFRNDVGLVEQIDIDKVKDADLFIFIGPEYEPWVQDMLDVLDQEDLKVLDLSRNVEFSKEYETNYYREYEPDEFLGVNLGFWLDFSKDQEIVTEISRSLGEQDPENAQVYEENAKAYNQKLNVLGMLYREKLSRCDSMSDPDKIKDAVLSVYLSNGFDIVQRKDFITLIYENLDLIIAGMDCS